MNVDEFLLRSTILLQACEGIMIRLDPASSSSVSSSVMEDRIVRSSMSTRLYGSQPLSAIAFLFESIRANDLDHAVLMIQMISYGSIVGRLDLYSSLDCIIFRFSTTLAVDAPVLFFRVPNLPQYGSVRYPNTDFPLVCWSMIYWRKGSSSQNPCPSTGRNGF